MFLDSNRFPKKPPSFYNTSKNVPQSLPQQQQQYSSTTINYKSTTSKPSTTSATTSYESSSVAELPETFGLPLNKLKKTTAKYASTQQNTLNATNSEIQIIGTQAKAASSNLGESASAPTLTGKQQQDNEIEIISENFPMSSSMSATVQNKILLNKASSKNLSMNSTNLSTDEKFKEYLNKNYNTDLSIACKPQCNFVSNIS